MDDLERHWELVRQGRLAQNERCRKAGKPLKWPKLASSPIKVPKTKSRAQVPPAPESGDEDDTALSFDEWKAAGWCVKKGEKTALFSIEGIPQFTRLQVRKNNPAWDKFRARKS